jgi:hypothetical protein
MTLGTTNTKKFQEDLKFGNSYEIKALQYLKYNTYEIKKGYFKEYDIILDNTTKVEVKAEKMAGITGNIAVEYSCSNKPSGILTTEADLWVHFIVYDAYADCYVIPINDLRNIVRNCRSVRGGDGMRARMYLVNKNMIQQYKTEKINKEIKE